MRTLSERDAAALLSVTTELAALEDVEPFPAHFMRLLGDVVGAWNASYSELDRRRELIVGGHWWTDGESGTAAAGERGPDDFWRLWRDHPVCGHWERTNDWTPALKVSDFETQPELRRTEIWDMWYRDLGVTDSLAAGLTPAGAVTRTFLFARTGGEFVERDRLVLELLMPYLQRRFDRVHAAGEAADALASLEEAGDEPRHVVLCSSRGTIEFASPEARRLLAHYVRCANGSLPEPALSAVRRRPVYVERDGRRLTLRAAEVGGLLVLLLGEEDTRLDRLTPRQRAVLDRVAQGETDAQIATALGIARQTVTKHLEHIFQRLGVHTRTAAALLAPAGPRDEA